MVDRRSPTSRADEVYVAPRGRLTRVVTSPVTRLALLLLLLVAAVVLGRLVDEWTVTGLRAVVADLGILGPVAYALIYAAAATAMVPASPFTVAAGILFGPVVGVVAAWAGATAGAVGGFGVGRAVGRSAVEELAGERIAGVDRFLAGRGFLAVLLLRLVPLFPFNVINLVSGVTALRLRDYALATAVGIVPGTVAFAALGGTIDDPTSPAFVGAVALLVVVTLAGGLASRRMRRRADAPTR